MISYYRILDAEIHQCRILTKGRRIFSLFIFSFFCSSWHVSKVHTSYPFCNQLAIVCIKQTNLTFHAKIFIHNDERWWVRADEIFNIMLLRWCGSLETKLCNWIHTDEIVSGIEKMNDAEGFSFIWFCEYFTSRKNKAHLFWFNIKLRYFYSNWCNILNVFINFICYLC